MSGKLDFTFASSDEACREVGQRLRAQRVSQDLQQQELALKAGVSKLTVINLEKTGKVTFLSFLKIVRALGLVDELSGLFRLQIRSIADMESASLVSGKRRVRRMK